jgi:3-dehydroquinate dehydratase/shikimate dehydrogenase
VARRPLLIEVIAQRTTAGAIEAYRRAHPRADLVEFRLDLLRDPDVDRLVAEKGKPKLMTLRSRPQGGEAAPADRPSLLRRLAKAPIEWLDLEPDDLGLAEMRRPGGPRRLLSWHDLATTPLDLEDRLARLLAEPRADLVKLVTYAEVAGDLLRIRDLLRRAPAGKVIAFGMGPKGVPSRILAPSWGGAGLFAPRRGAPASAPGQVPVEDLVDTYRVDTIGPSTGLLGVLGHPVGHSLSPFIHNAACAALQLDLRYLPFEADTVAEFFPVLSELRVRGLSVTLPFKETIVPHLDRLGPGARRLGAVNTVVKVWNRLEGHNTDAAASLLPLRGWLKLRGARVGVLGAGGAARALVASLAQRGARVTVFSRAPERGRALAEEWGVRALPWGRARGFRCDLLVNATPVGMSPRVRALPIPIAAVGARRVYDLVYTPEETAFVRRARSRGLEAKGGLGMFLAQGTAQFRLFTGRRAPVAVMRRALREAIDAR